MWQKDLTDYEYIEGAADDQTSLIFDSLNKDIVSVPADELDTFDFSKHMITYSGNNDDRLATVSRSIGDDDNSKTGGRASLLPQNFEDEINISFNETNEITGSDDITTFSPLVGGDDALSSLINLETEDFSDYNGEKGGRSSYRGRVIALGDWIKMGGTILDKDIESEITPIEFSSSEESEENILLSGSSEIEITLDDDNDDRLTTIRSIGDDDDIEIEFQGSAEEVEEDPSPMLHLPSKKNEGEELTQLKKIIPAAITECSITRTKIDPSFKGVCSSDETVKKIASVFDVSKENSPKEILEAAKKETSCSNEICVLRSKKVIEKVGDHKITKEIASNFKLNGPVDITLLSNINIDDAILNQWMDAFPDFFNMGFTMSDFDLKQIRHDDVFNIKNLEPDRTGNGLGSVSIVNILNPTSKFKTAASVLNTDVHSGAGKHWMAMFIDARKKEITIEFFNSSGNVPQINFKSWMSAAATLLTSSFPGKTVKEVIVTRMMHQHSQTECGVYALFYIWARLNGIPYESFKNSRVPDELMLEFRQHLFSGGIFKAGEQWNFDKYKRLVKVKWESGFSY
jgi:hypothetical protein